MSVYCYLPNLIGLVAKTDVQDIATELYFRIAYAKIASYSHSFRVRGEPSVWFSEGPIPRLCSIYFEVEIQYVAQQDTRFLTQCSTAVEVAIGLTDYKYFTARENSHDLRYELEDIQLFVSYSSTGGLSGL